MLGLNQTMGNSLPKFCEFELKEIVSQLKQHYKPEKIILFGSAARGNWRSGSDVDLFIVKKTDKPHTQRAWEVGKILFDKINLPVDAVIYTPQEVKYAQKIRSMFLEEVFGEGRILYG